MPQAVMALAEQLGLTDIAPANFKETLSVKAGEHETDYVIRALPVLGAVANAQVSTFEARLGKLGEGLIKLGCLDAEAVAAKDFDPVGAAINIIKGLKASLRAQKGAATRARGEAEELKESAKPRSLGPVENQLKVEELAELFAGNYVEVAFSDGSKELSGVPAILMEGSNFKFARGRLLLNRPDLTVKGPVDERGTRALVGYAFLIDGEQVAYAPRLGGQLTLGPGQTYNLAGDIILN